MIEEISLAINREINTISIKLDSRSNKSYNMYKMIDE